MTKTEVLALLKDNQDERGIENWKKLEAKHPRHLKSFGIGLTKLRKMAKTIGRDHKLSGQLWNSDIYDAKVIALLIDDPKVMTRETIEQQVEHLHGGLLTHVFSTCGATLSKTPMAVEVACDWLESHDKVRRRCGWALIYEISKFSGKKAPDEAFFSDCIQRIQASIQDEEDMWVRESMKSALMGIGKRTAPLNKAAIRAVKSIGPVDVDYGDDNGCEPLDVMKHLKSDYLKKKFGS